MANSHCSDSKATDSLVGFIDKTIHIAHNLDINLEIHSRFQNVQIFFFSVDDAPKYRIFYTL